MARNDLQNGQVAGSGQEAEQPAKLSVRLSALDTGRDSTVGEIVDSLGSQAFGATMFVFAAPNLVPNPPGTSPILGLPLLFLAVQLILGRETVWLPDWLRRRPLSRQFLAILAQRVAPMVSWLERALRPRLGGFASTRIALRLVGLVSLPLAGVLLLPLPFLHILPGAAMTALAAGLAERDGFAILAGYVLAVVTFAAFAFIGFAVHSGVASVLGPAGI